MIRAIMISLLATLLYADIDSEIEAIQHAPIKDRFKLMNALKHKLIQMREQERSAAIDKLKSITKTAPTDLPKEEKNKVHIQKEIEQHIQEEIEHETENHGGKEDDD